MAISLAVGGLYWALPASSQATCPLTESYASTGGTPIISNTTPLIEFTVNSPSSVTIVIASGATLCDVNGQDRNLADPSQTAGWMIAPGQSLTHTAPAGWIIQGIVVRALDNATTTTTSSTTSTSSTSSTSSTTSTSTSTSTTTTSTTVPASPPGPGNGPVPIRSDAVVDRSPDLAAVRGTERVDAVVANTSGEVLWSSTVPSPWTAYANLGRPSSGSIKGNPALVTWDVGRLDIFVRGADDKLWQKYSTDGGGSWSEWIKPVGDEGVLASAPEATTRGPGRYDLFVTGTDGAVYQRFYDGGWNPQWIGQGGPEGGGAASVSGGKSDPGAVAWGSSERVDLFARGTDNRLWQKFWDGSSWTAWFKPVGDVGVLDSEPEAASWEPGNLLVFVKGTNGAAYALPFGPGGWGTWIRLVRSTDVFTAGFGATSRGSGRFDLLGRGTDNLGYFVWQ